MQSYLLTAINLMSLNTLHPLELWAHILTSPHRCDGMFQCCLFLWIMDRSVGNGLLSLLLPSSLKLSRHPQLESIPEEAYAHNCQ